MPTLTFSVENQTIRRTDNFYVVADSKNYLHATFTFSDDWGDGTKTAQFLNTCSLEVFEVLLDESGMCLVPWEVLQDADIKVKVTVFAGDLITANSASFRVHESGYSEDGESSSPPTPGVYQQIIERLDDIEQMEVIAETLPPGSDATASYDDGVMTLGIPQGEKGDPGKESVRYGTSEYWCSQPDLISEAKTVYVYTDHLTYDGQPVPGFKVGDGMAYLIDLPFSDDIAMAHINNTLIHVTAEEKEFWNNKVTAYINAADLENLVLSKE